MKIKAYADYGWVNTTDTCIMEVDDDFTDDQIEAEIWEWAIERVGVSWEVVD